MILKENIQDISSLGGNAIYGIAALLFLFSPEGENVFWQLITAYIFVCIITIVTRFVHFSDRPDHQKYGRNIISKLDASGFPSLHAGRAAALAVIIMNYFQNSWVIIISILTILGVAIARVALKRHHVIDVMFGAILGVASALLTIKII